MPAPNRPVDEHGFPIPVTFEDDSKPRRRLSPRQKGWIRALLAILVVVVIGGILFGPQLKQGYFESLAEWHAMQAQDEFFNGDPVAAAAEMTDAIYWLPNSAGLYERRAQYHTKAQNLDAALADWNKALELNPKYYPGYMERSVIYCRLGKFSESLADATTAVDLATTGNAQVLNHRAYMRALAKQELKEGLADVERAIKLTREPFPAFLDTRGYLHHLLGNQQAGLADLNQAIQITEAQRANPEDLFERRQRRDGRIMGLDAREIAMAVERLGENLAVMYHHRAEVHEKLGQDEAAAADFKQADTFGYDPAKGIF